MNWSWIARILWARRAIILVAMGCSLLGGVLVAVNSPPRYLATARVTLNYVRPDPITGQYMSTKMVNAYVSSQVQMIRDYQVTIPAVEALGWLDDPALQDAYAQRPPDDTRDFQQWVASRLVGATSARMVEDSNILQVEFRAPSPQSAKAVVEALRQAYIDGNVYQRQASAGQSADALSERATALQGKIDALQSAKAEYERATGVVLGQGARDPESGRLKELATAKDHAHLPAEEGLSTAAQQLMELDARIAALSSSLGPNNPALMEAQRRRQTLAAQVAAERNQAAAAGSVLAQMASMRTRLLEETKAKVLSQREEVLRLRLYEDEIERYQAQLSKVLTLAASQRAVAAANESGISPLGEPEARPKPVFPNPPLILGGSGGLGLVLGVLLALLTESLRRRVRGVTDLELAGLGPVIGSVPKVRKHRHLTTRGLGRTAKLPPLGSRGPAPA